jgi:hypothetical protein
MHRIIPLLVAGVIGGLTARADTAWTDMTRRYVQSCSGAKTRWTLCGLSYIVQREPSMGGPQALEGYTQLAHESGTVALALGTIGNVEVAGRGQTNEVRSMQAGGVITGDGSVAHWSGITLSRPVPVKGARGSIQRYDYITFDNGWSIRPDGEKLMICNRDSVCRPL